MALTDSSVAPWHIYQSENGESKINQAAEKDKQGNFVSLSFNLRKIPFDPLMKLKHLSLDAREITFLPIV